MMAALRLCRASTSGRARLGMNAWTKVVAVGGVPGRVVGGHGDPHRVADRGPIIPRAYDLEAAMTDHATHAAKARRFLELHQPGRPLLLPNPWDQGSARLLAWLGFQAL